MPGNENWDWAQGKARIWADCRRATDTPRSRCFSPFQQRKPFYEQNLNTHKHTLFPRFIIGVTDCAKVICSLGSRGNQVYNLGANASRRERTGAARAWELRAEKGTPWSWETAQPGTSEAQWPSGSECSGAGSLGSLGSLDYYVARDAFIATRRGLGAVPPLAGLALSGDRGRCSSEKRRRDAWAVGGGGARRPYCACTHTQARAHPGTHTWSLGEGGEESRSECLKIESRRAERSTRTGGRRRARAARPWVRRSAPGQHGHAGAG